MSDVYACARVVPMKDNYLHAFDLDLHDCVDFPTLGEAVKDLLERLRGPAGDVLVIVRKSNGNPPVVVPHGPVVDEIVKRMRVAEDAGLRLDSITYTPTPKSRLARAEAIVGAMLTDDELVKSSSCMDALHDAITDLLILAAVWGRSPVQVSYACRDRAIAELDEGDGEE